MYVQLVWFDSFYIRVSTMTAIDGRSQIKVLADEQTRVHSARSSFSCL